MAAQKYSHKKQIVGTCFFSGNDRQWKTRCQRPPASIGVWMLERAVVGRWSPWLRPKVSLKCAWSIKHVQFCCSTTDEIEVKASISQFDLIEFSADSPKEDLAQAPFVRQSMWAAERGSMHKRRELLLTKHGEKITSNTHCVNVGCLIKMMQINLWLLNACDI